MFDPARKIHEISLRWKAIIYEEDNEKRRIIYQRTKGETENLRDFICAEKNKKAKISADYFIDGFELGLWLNLNYFRRKVAGEDFANNLSFGIEKFNFAYNQLIFKRLFGQKITLEDCQKYIAAAPQYSAADAEALMEEENENVVLYCSGCCGDRLCGCFAIQIEEYESKILWKMPFYGKNIICIAFEKSAYTAAFYEYKQLIFTDF